MKYGKEGRQKRALERRIRDLEMHNKLRKLATDEQRPFMLSEAVSKAAIAEREIAILQRKLGL